MDKQETQKKYLEFQTLNQQVKQLQDSLINLEQQLLELRKLEESLDGIKNTNINEEVLVLLGAGTYIKTKLADNKKVLMNIGSDTLTPKNTNDSIKLVRLQINELTEIYDKMNEEIKAHLSNLHKLHSDLQKSNIE